MIQVRKKVAIITVSVFATICIGCLCIYYASNPWGFARQVSIEEAIMRLSVVNTAEKYLGYNESDQSHCVIIDIYNNHEPLAQNYLVTYEDSWCAAFVSAISIQCGFTEIIPTECGCERQIGLFQNIGRWEEKDSYIPLPGDIVYYDWVKKFSFDDCTGWSDHVGIVVGTAGPFMKVIEGNKNDAVEYRYIPINHPEIRGFGLPDYTAVIP